MRLLTTFAVLCPWAGVKGWSPKTSFLPQTLSTRSRRPFSTQVPLAMNLFSDLGDIMTGGKLVPHTLPLPYGEPLAGNDAVSDDVRTFAIQERLVTFTGEDFDVRDLDGQTDYVRVRGAMLHLPGKDKMRIISSETNEKLCVMDRKLMAMKPTYDVYNGNGEKVGWLEKAALTLTSHFDFYAECEKGGVGPFAAPPVFKLEGDFLNRRFVMKNKNGEAVAKVTMDRLVEFDEYDHYQVRVAPGMDSVLALACACAIDEEFDEEHKKEREKREE